MPSDQGYKIVLTNNCIVNSFDTGKYNVQGQNQEPVKKVLSSISQDGGPINKNVFVVYGHDHVSRVQLEAILRRWDLTPIILDQLPPDGKTIIEQLEDNIAKANCGIVLATPDDVGFPNGDETKKKYRVRQNVVLELGMLLSRLGREKVAILVKDTVDMEKPSDIGGLIYLSFKDNVEEAKTLLAKQLHKYGYYIAVDKL